MLSLKNLAIFFAFASTFATAAKNDWNGFQLIQPSAQNSYNGTGDPAWYQWNVTFLSWTKKEAMNKKKYVDSAEQTWDLFVTGMWYDDYYTFAPSDTVASASRIWQYNNGSTEPYDWQYDLYTNWASYPQNSTGFTMNFVVGLEGYDEDGNAVTFFGNYVSFMKEAMLNQTGTFDEPEMAKCEEFWGHFLNGSWSSDYVVTHQDTTAENDYQMFYEYGYRTWDFWVNMTVPSNESIINDASNSTVNFTFDLYTTIGTNEWGYTDMGNYSVQNWTYDDEANFTHTTNLWQQTLDNFAFGQFCSDPMFSQNNQQVQFDWCSYNGSAEPWDWVNSDLRTEYLNESYYGEGTRFQFNLTSTNNVTTVLLWSNDPLGSPQEMNDQKALAMATWDAIIQGHFSEPYYMYPTMAKGESYYSIALNLTNPNTTAHEIDFTILANNASSGMLDNATVIFNSPYAMDDDSTESVWQQFLSGAWNYNQDINYYDNGTTEMRFWNFAEISKNTRGQAVATESLSVLGQNMLPFVRNNKTELPSDAVKRLRLQKDQDKKVTGVQADDVDQYTAGGKISTSSWLYYGQTQGQYGWIGFVYAAYAPIDENFAIGYSMWKNFTTGYPQGEIYAFSNTSGYVAWMAGDGNGGWTWDDSPELHTNLPSSWPDNMSFQWQTEFYSYGMYSPFDIFIDVYSSNSSLEVQNSEIQAVVGKSFASFLSNNTLQEPLYWYPSWNDVYGGFQYNVSLSEDNTTGIYLDINATSTMTNMNATNVSPVYFRSTDPTKNLTTNAAQDLVNEVWDSFLDGNWANNMTYGFQNQTGVRIWNFEEKNAMFKL